MADVFRAHKEPDLIVQWLGPAGTQDGHRPVRLPHRRQLQLHAHRARTALAYEFSGVFHTVRENEFAIQTFEFGGYPDVVSTRVHSPLRTSAATGAGIDGPLRLPEPGGPRRHGAVRHGRRHDGGLRAAR